MVARRQLERQRQAQPLPFPAVDRTPPQHLELVEDERALAALAVLGRDRPGQPSARRRGQGHDGRERRARAQHRDRRQDLAPGFGLEPLQARAELAIARDRHAHRGEQRAPGRIRHLAPPPPVVGIGRHDAVVLRQTVERARLTHQA
jgi:hypothetical protein